MTRMLWSTAALCLLASASAPPGTFTPIDLKAQANHKLADDFGLEGNNLASVLSAGGTLAGVNFKIDKGVVMLGSKLLGKEFPAKIEGIKVDKTCAKLHILHATQYGNGGTIGQDGKDGDPRYIADGTKIAEYKIIYEDKTTVSIPVVYGEDVRDWWLAPNAKGVSRGKLAWKGDNELAQSYNCQIRLYLTTWENPHPAKKIVTIDYLKVNDTPAAPFCVAMTLEAKAK